MLKKMSRSIMKNFCCLTVILLFLTSTLFAEEISPDFYGRLSKSGFSLTSYVVVVAVPEQKLKIFKNGKFLKSFIISTAKNGTGQEIGSGQTPLGLHRISEKFGFSSPPDTIFVGRQSTGRKWVVGATLEKDLILTRILWLEGLERGLNQGPNIDGMLVDSRKRMIYIHGTNREDLLGTPASQGCIRMEKQNVMEIFEKVPTGSLVWIEE
jgi:lipoprotein-anchoring transpeptidase ErfK/SrfK